MKIKYKLGLIGVVLFVVALAAALLKQHNPYYKNVLEFIYFDPHGLNADVNGLFEGWLSENNASKYCFRQKVVSCFRRHSGISESALPDDAINALCEKVRIEIKNGPASKMHPRSIRCELTVSGDNENAVEQLAQAYKETILSENKRENECRALKSMKNLWHEYSVRDRELHRLRGRLSKLKDEDDEKLQLESAVAEAELAFGRFKSMCDQEVKKHCETWGVSIIFTQ